LFAGKPAVHGPPPLFPEKLHVGRPNLGDRGRLLARFEDLLDRGWLTNGGVYVEAFEQEIAAYVGVKHCIAVCNATIGLQIAVRALRLTGEVIVPSFTFPATVHALAWEGLTPVFCDVDPRTHNIDPHAAEKLIGPQTTGILGVHLWGNACDVDALSDIADLHGLRLFFDAAHAFGCSHAGRLIGNFGEAEVFSFHATKFLNSGEGGAIVTNDDDLAEDMRRLRAFGLEEGEVAGLGTNAKMPELSAALGLTNLESRDQFIAINRRNNNAYVAALRNACGLALLPLDDNDRHNHQYIVVEVDRRRAGLTRNEIVSALHAANVLAKRYFAPGCHRMPPYRDTPLRSPLPHTERLCDCLLQLPTGSAVSTADIARIGEFLCGLTASTRRRAA
jgi:dTDP-4-amino-4,6-dideoxygalactose transaminase